MAGGELRLGTVSIYMRYMVVNRRQISRTRCAVYMGTNRNKEKAATRTSAGLRPDQWFEVRAKRSVPTWRPSNPWARSALPTLQGCKVLYPTTISEPDLDLRSIAGAAGLAVADAGQAERTRCRVGRVVPLGGRHVQPQLRPVPEPRARAQRRAERQLGQLLRGCAVRLLLRVPQLRQQLEVLRHRIRRASADRRRGGLQA